jgi:iron complex outermembrane receptor protein
MAFRQALTAFALPAILAAQTPAPREVTAKLEPFEVTGSRIKRLDYELPSPVVTFTAEDIAATGYVTFGEFIQNLSFNNGDSNSELNPTGSFVPSAVTANPRGLGSNRLLTLVNGRRAAPFSLTNGSSGSPQSVFNFNSIPFEAVERVEYLKDGASALYGSDAITGVMNIILKKNYSGASLELFANNTLGHDSQTRRVSFVAGGAKRGWDGLLGLTHQERHASYLPDFGVTSTDYRALGAKGTDWRSILMPPSFLNLTAAQATAAGIGTSAGYYVIAGGVPTPNPTRTSFTYAGTTTASLPSANRYDNVSDVQINPASDTTSIFGTVGRRLTTDVSAYAQVTYNRSQTYYEDLPIVLSNDIFTLAAANPYNPLGLSLPGSRFAFSTGDFQTRSKVSSQAVTAVAGLRGRVGEIWEWESAVNYGANHTIYAQDMARLDEVQAAVSGTTRGTAYNPFGPSDNPNLIPDLFRHRVTINDNLADVFGATLTVSGKPWKLPLRGAGELGAAAGYEFRHESLDVRPNQRSGYFALIGAAQLPWSGHRQVHALSAEINVPLQKWIEFQLAVRHERYSDLGTTTNPKVGVALRLPETRFVHVMLRASRSESFKAPDFGQLHQPRTGSGGGPSLVDPLRPQDGARTYFQYIGGSPVLEPEKGTVQFAGAVFDVKAVRGLSFTVDFLDIQMRSVINKLDLAYLFSPEGRRLFPDAIVRDNSVQNPGPVSHYLGLYFNHGFQLYRGWDFGARYLSPRTRWGRLSFNASATQVVKKGTDFGTGAGFVDHTGDHTTPVWRSNLSAGWSREKISATVAANIIGKLYNRRFTSAGWGENSYVIITPTLSYRGFARTTLSLTCGNVFDHRPPENGRANIRGFDFRVSGVGASGRTLSLRARREF